MKILINSILIVLLFTSCNNENFKYIGCYDYTKLNTPIGSIELNAMKNIEIITKKKKYFLVDINLLYDIFTLKVDTNTSILLLKKAHIAHARYADVFILFKADTIYNTLSFVVEDQNPLVGGGDSLEILVGKTDLELKNEEIVYKYRITKNGTMSDVNQSKISLDQRYPLPFLKFEPIQHVGYLER